MQIDTIYLGDALEVLKTFPDGCIDCCVTSPPYFGLRDYGTARWIGGDPECDHIFLPDSDVDKKYSSRLTSSHILRRSRVRCPKCGAFREDAQLGLEDTPDQYIANLTDVFVEVYRVLKPEGTLWLNIGDSYNGYKGNAKQTSFETMYAGHRHQPARRTLFGLESKDLKPKDLIGIPWMLAFSLRSAGWYLRQDIIWAKPNPMPESVTDRCTKSHEYIFLLSKSEKYYYNAEAIREDSVYKDSRRSAGRIEYSAKWIRKTSNDQPGFSCVYESRNKRDVWTVATRPFNGAHFATFPRDLIFPCIQAGCPDAGLVLDPFMGSGTTGLVARQLGCHYVGIELNPEYRDLAQKRIAEEGETLFNQR